MIQPKKEEEVKVIKAEEPKVEEPKIVEEVKEEIKEEPKPKEAELSLEDKLIDNPNYIAELLDVDYHRSYKFAQKNPALSKEQLVELYFNNPKLLCFWFSSSIITNEFLTNYSSFNLIISILSICIITGLYFVKSTSKLKKNESKFSRYQIPSLAHDFCLILSQPKFDSERLVFGNIRSPPLFSRFRFLL